ncbi:protein GPR108 [Parambassis ranga]|uniref:Protein GPR108 n=1 Tax=Parambassis ranga TaxID=210632 RepID=A0A6P7J2H0_9TELE|nr:protein GPR108 [Parambassis ranga]
MAEENRVCFVAGFLLLLLLSGCTARIHTLTLTNDTRSTVDLNNFGFFANGTLEVNLSSLQLDEKRVNYSKYPVGFTLSRSRVNGVLSYTAEEPETCPLTPPSPKQANDEPLIFFLIDINKLSVIVKTMGVQDNILTAEEKDGAEKGQRKARDSPADPAAPAAPPGPPAPAAPAAPAVPAAPAKPPENGDEPAEDKKNKESAVQKPDEQKGEKPNTEVEAKKVAGKTFHLDKPTQLVLALKKVDDLFNFSFHMVIGPKAEGLYSLKFHYCRNRGPVDKLPYSFTVGVREKNPGGFLSAAEIPLSRLYICMAGVFFTAATVWVYTLMKHRYSVFKIHWLMAALAFTKSTSLVFHSINYHFINTEGHPIEAWAVMYYITHLLKGALLFITLALIGTGWAFVKYILSDKEKKIFMIVIPLQVLANVAFIIIESTEEGSSEYYLWKEILFLVDLICCGAILFPVVWSIRHLQEASSTDGKAAMNLEKLKLFRHYYVMIVCYIYFTRIIAILLKITMPFQWQWCYEFLVEVSTLIFFVLTGYKFRPASNNPYLQLPQDEEDVEMDEVVTESGALEGISKVKKTSNGRERQKESTL